MIFPIVKYLQRQYIKKKLLAILDFDLRNKSCALDYKENTFRFKETITALYDMTTTK